MTNEKIRAIIEPAQPEPLGVTEGTATPAGAAPLPCGRCNGSGWVVRDPDIGTDQECCVCEGRGVIEGAPVTLPDDAYMPKICVEPDAWATTDNCVGPNLGKVRYDKLPIQSLNPLQYTHEKMYSHRSVIGLMKAAYYDGYSEREKEVRATESAPLPDEVAQMVEALRRHEWVPVIQQAADMIERLSAERDSYKAMLKEQLAAGVPPDCVVVPKAAMDWLMGLGDDFDPDRPGKYWWRSKFRELIAAVEVKP